MCKSNQEHHIRSLNVRITYVVFGEKNPMFLLIKVHLLGDCLRELTSRTDREALSIAIVWLLTVRKEVYFISPPINRYILKKYVRLINVVRYSISLKKTLNAQLMNYILKLNSINWFSFPPNNRTSNLFLQWWRRVVKPST